MNSIAGSEAGLSVAAAELRIVGWLVAFIILGLNLNKESSSEKAERG